MIGEIVQRMLTEVPPHLMTRFLWNCGFKSLLAVEQFKRRLKKGIVFPPFIYMSITNACQLKCQGCWVSVVPPRNDDTLPTHCPPPQHLPKAAIDAIITQAKTQGNRLFGLLGGEPLLHPYWADILADHPDCYFQLFTNGQLLTAEVARTMAQLGNVTPLISIEGGVTESIRRRGNGRPSPVLEATLAGVEQATRHGLITGVATSLCRNNLDDCLTEKWLAELVARGVHYYWLYGYRPVGPDPAPEMALTPDQLTRARQFIVAMRSRQPIAIVDAYWDHAGRAVCPMSMGLSHHINPWGQIEPCPILQFSAESVTDGPIHWSIPRSSFLHDMRTLSAQATRGCVLVERPDLVRQIIAKHSASESAHRLPILSSPSGGALAELCTMHPGCSHHQPGQEIPETHWAYRLAKKHYFFGFGAYG